MRRWMPFLLMTLFLCGVLWAQDEIDARRIAVRKLAERAETGDGKSLYDLARLHETGYDSIAIDTLRSLSLYMKAAEKGYAPARNYIGFKYYNGDGLTQNTDSALYWIHLAADDGDITAAANLGYLLTEGRGVAHDVPEALKWLTIASEGGVTGAQIKLVELEEEKWKGLPTDSLLKDGIRYYIGRAPILGSAILEIVADRDVPKAMAILGDAYSKGLGVPYNHQKSIDYFFMAADKGDPSAQFIVAEMLEIFPDVIPSDSVIIENSDALYWYERAKEGGVTDSDKAYQLLFTLP